MRDFADRTVARDKPREPQIDPRHVSMPVGALEGLTAIDRALGAGGR